MQDLKSDVHGVIELLRSKRMQALIASGDAELIPPAHPVMRQRLSEKLGLEIYNDLLPLMEVLDGVLIKNKSDTLPLLSFSPSNPDSNVWLTLYPKSIEMGASEEFLYWDLSEPMDPRVYYVFHDPPCHCMCFDSLSQCFEWYLEPNGSRRILDKLSKDPVWPSISQSRFNDKDINRFLSGFPDHYWIHDFRDAPLFSWFPYSAKGVITRYKNQRFWIQQRPKGFVEKLKWALQ